MNHKYHVICICLGQGFPVGMAQTSRIRMIGKCLVSEKVKFTVLNIGGGLIKNLHFKGIIDGIEFQYCPGLTTRPPNSIIRKLMYIIGLLMVCIKLIVLRITEKKICVYSWFEGGKYAIFHRFLQFIKIPVIQEINEWWPDHSNLIKRNNSLKTSQGTLAISIPIIQKLQKLPSFVSNVSKHKIIHIPILIEPNEWFLEKKSHNRQQYVLWCGNIESSFRDIYFLMKVIKVVNHSDNCKLLLVGQFNESTQLKIMKIAESINIDEYIQFTGFVSDNKLKILMKGATALLLPLWNTERSICRFPTKLGHYLSSGTPVVTSSIGNLIDYLENRKSACITQPARIDSFAEEITFLIQNKKQAEFIGREGKKIATKYFSVKRNKTQLSKFFIKITNYYET